MSGSGGHTGTAIVSVLMAVVGVAIVAVLVSDKAKTGSVLDAFGQTINKILCVALSPITGGNCNIEKVDSVFRPLPERFY